jgi:hypothetical protein
MKSVIAISLALFALASSSRADQILIYKGQEGQRSNLGLIEYHLYYLLFDLTTLQKVSVEYGGLSNVADYYYSAGAPTSFVYVPITTGTNTSSTCLASGTDYVSNSFSLKFGLFIGPNSKQALGGSLSGDYPAALSYVGYNRSGDGSTGTDKVIDDTGIFSLAADLTQESNTSNDNLTTATAIVTNRLKAHGFAPE